MRGINDSITHSLRALLARYSRTTRRVSLHCRLNVFCLFCAAKVRIFREETKNPRRLCILESLRGKGFIGLRKYHQGLVTGLVLVPGVSSPHPETDGLKVISAASLVNFKV